MKKKLLALFLVAGASAFARTHFSVGFGVGPAYVPPPPAVAYVAPAPGPGYAWISGYYYPVGPRYVWRPGYWARPPYAHAVWVGPRFHGGRYFAGYWRR
ncbi:MAG: YXWGXW repeat-containing protein [Acidobacteriia bacterium]|nr:YXWGXW repeat-containing protein [Terriglobia bacterium]